MDNEALHLLKTVADETRIRILRALYEKDYYVELLAERLNLSPATVSFHLKKLQLAGIVDARREQYYMIYTVKKAFLNKTLAQLIFDGDENDTAEALREEQYRRKVLRAFMPDGVCRQMPAQLKKRVIVYREIFSHFEKGKSYPEKEVNEIIGRIHEDYCTVRRGFVAMGWMTRNNGIYTVNPDPDFDHYEDINA